MYRGNQVKAHEDLGRKTSIYKPRREDSGKKKKSISFPKTLTSDLEPLELLLKTPSLWYFIKAALAN